MCKRITYRDLIEFNETTDMRGEKKVPTQQLVSPSLIHVIHQKKKKNLQKYFKLSWVKDFYVCITNVLAR